MSGSYGYGVNLAARMSKILPEQRKGQVDETEH